MNKDFWLGKRVFLTGNTGFKGSWLSLWLQILGARVFGYALLPPTRPNLFEEAMVGENMECVFADIRDLERLKNEMKAFAPEIVIHMAAQPLVRYSYINPVETYSTNVMGTVNLFEAVRATPSVRSVINITTDKCYENREWVWGYRETDPMGGYDPYSNSKACSELVTSAYRSSFFNAERQHEHGVALASARAGNVIGGGDWATDRLIPDLLKAFIECRPAVIRNPGSIRPWQHVLEPLRGYLTLAEKMYEDGITYSQAWNFGPEDEDAWSVEQVAETLIHYWGQEAEWQKDLAVHVHEAAYLKLDITKASRLLGWRPKLGLRESISMIVDWTKHWKESGDARHITTQQIINYQENRQQIL